MAAMSAVDLEALVKNASNVADVVDVLINKFHSWFGGVGNVREKARYLEITLVNMSTKNQRVVMEDNWFDSGRFWSAPFGSIPPGSAKTFFVCDKDGSLFTGVSGGIGLRVYKGDSKNVFEDGNGSWWICTFSNPYSGSSKCLTKWKGFGIKPLWEEMDKAHVVTDARCGCYQKADKHMVFLWKDPETHW